MVLKKNAGFKVVYLLRELLDNTVKSLSSDMGRGLPSGIAEVFPVVPHFICHFHFLRDIGKDLLEKEYALISNICKSCSNI